MPRVSEDFRKQMEGYGLTTAKIFYYHPDYTNVINNNWILHQLYDLFPEFPGLKAYLEHWDRENDGKVAFVRVSHNKLIKPAEIRPVGAVYQLH